MDAIPQQQQVLRPLVKHSTNKPALPLNFAKTIHTVS